VACLSTVCASFEAGYRSNGVQDLDPRPPLHRGAAPGRESGVMAIGHLSGLPGLAAAFSRRGGGCC
jgi:hypothetical protein